MYLPEACYKYNYREDNHFLCFSLDSKFLQVKTTYSFIFLPQSLPVVHNCGVYDRQYRSRTFLVLICLS